MGDIRGGSTRARNVLQHGLEWMKEDAFCEGLNDRGKVMLSRLIDMQARNKQVAYSLIN